MELNQVTVPVSDQDRAVAFYKQLGLKLIVFAEYGYARFECPGGSTFSIEVVKEPVSDHPLTVYFETERLDEGVARLKADGVSFETDPADMAWGWREARLRDPDGNRLCLYWAGANRRFPSWRLPEA